MGLIKIPAMIEASGGGAETPEISPDGSGRSMEFIGTEQLSDRSVSCTHFRNKFSVMFWARHTAAAAKTFCLAEETVAGEGRFHASSTSGVTQRVRIRNPGITAPEAKDYIYTIDTVPDLWHQTVIVVEIDASNSTNEQVIIYVNGVKVTPTKTIDSVLLNRNSVTMTSLTNWGLAVGNQHSIAIWNKVLKPKEVLRIYNNGKGNLDLSKRQGSYRSQKRLRHWWFWDVQPANINNVARDYGKSRTSEPTNLLQNSTAIDGTDSVLDAPGY